MSIAGTGSKVLANWPHRRVLLGLLAVSLVLNICFVAGAVWTRVQPPPAAAPEQRLHRIAAELDLDDQQRAAFRHYVSGTRARTDKVHDEVAPLIAGAWEEIAKPQADSARVLRLFDEAAAKRQSLQHEATSQTLQFLSLLSPEQRRRFVAIMRERRSARRNR